MNDSLAGSRRWLFALHFFNCSFVGAVFKWCNVRSVGWNCVVFGLQASSQRTTRFRPTAFHPRRLCWVTCQRSYWNMSGPTGRTFETSRAKSACAALLHEEGRESPKQAGATPSQVVHFTSSEHSRQLKLRDGLRLTCLY